MIVNLTKKERTLLEDQKNNEEICIKSYEQYANLNSCSELKDLLQSHAATEKSHLNSINQLLSGQLPNVNAQGGSSQGQGQSGQGASGQGTSMGGMQGQASQASAMGGMQGQA